MIIPYSTDKTDNFIGYGAIGIMVACALAFLVTWPMEDRLEERLTTDSLRVWTQEAQVKQAERIDSLSRQADGSLSDSGDRDIDNVSNPELKAIQQSMSKFQGGPPVMTDSLKKRMHNVVVRESPLYLLGFYPAGGRWFPGILTHQFLHGGWMHLIGNMIFFFAFGVAIERRFGLKAFLALYLGGGMFAALCQAGADAGLHMGHLSDSTMVGASGSIAVAMGAYLRCYPTSHVKVFVWVFRPKLGQIPAWLFLGFWILIEFLRSHFEMPNQVGGGTAYMAHVSGFFLGFAIAPFLPVTDEIREQEDEEKARKARGGLSISMHPGMEHLAASIHAATAPAPAASFLPEAPIKPLVDQAWDARAKGDDAEAAALFQRQFQNWIRGGSSMLDSLANTILRLERDAPGWKLEPLVLWECGMKLSTEPHHVDAARICLQHASSAQPPLAPSLLARCRETLATLAPPPASTAQPARPAFAPLPPRPGGPSFLGSPGTIGLPSHSATPPRPMSLATPPAGLGDLALPPVHSPRPSTPAATPAKPADGRPPWLMD